jgi:tetratricopeptide (TPR) repeat protein
MLALLCLPVAAGAGEGDLRASQEAAFRRGNDHYFHGRYAPAVEAYEQVVALGVIAEDLYYNLGNAYLKAGSLGPAIYNYERALELDPTQEDVLFNLKAVREAAKRRGSDRLEGAEGVPWWMRTVSSFTLGGLSWAFLVLYASVFVLLMVLHFVQPGFLRVSLWALFAFLALGACGTGTLLAGRLYLAERVEQGIVLPDAIPVKEGPDPNYQSLFSVHAGLRVRITEKEQDWVRVRLSNGLEGWLRERDLGRL